MHAIDFLEKGCQAHPDRLLARDPERQVSYAQAWEASGRIAAALVDAGIRPGARVATYAPNRVEMLLCQYGAMRTGAIWVPLNFRNTADETRNLLERYRIEWLFFDPAFEHTVADFGELPTLRGCVGLAPNGFAPDLASWIACASTAAPLPALRPEWPAAILTTSGTTGSPKGALHSHRSWAAMIASFAIELRFETPPVHLVVAPLSHAAGCLHWTVLAQGGTNVLLPNADAYAVLAAIEHERANLLFLPPTVIYMMLAHCDLARHDYRSLRCFLYGAAPMSVHKLREAVRAFGPVMAQGYGQSEALMMCTYLSPEDHVRALADPALERRIASAGREAPLSRIGIMDEHGALLPPESPGEIVIRAEYVMDGYFEQPEATADVSRHGWHHTGDVGYKDADGFVYLVDRKRDLIISGGFNVYPAEVEQAALAHPAVQDCAVVGEPHEKWGEAVLAVVELKADAAWDEAAFLAFCREHLGGVKTPKRVEVWPTLPRSSVGKVLRREVRRRYWEAHERQI